jgi:hypothetical protein
MGLLDDPSKLLKPADVERQWNTGAPYQGMPRMSPMQGLPRSPSEATGALPPMDGLPGRLPPMNGLSPGREALPPMNGLPPGRLSPMNGLPPQAPMNGLPRSPSEMAPQSSSEDPRQTILALFKRFGLT